MYGRRFCGVIRHVSGLHGGFDYNKLVNAVDFAYLLPDRSFAFLCSQLPVVLGRDMFQNLVSAEPHKVANDFLLLVSKKKKNVGRAIPKTSCLWMWFGY